MKQSKKLTAGLSVTFLASALAACGSDLPDEPTGYECNDWEWDYETETYYCDDYDSPHYKKYFLAKKLYPSKSSLKQSTKYNDYVKSGKSGLGSGVKGGSGG